MVTTKKCAFGDCRNDSRYPKLWRRNQNGDPVKFYHFPGQIRHKERRRKWIRACHRGDFFKCTKDSYICSIHFVGEDGPTKEHPDPISAIASEERIKRLSRQRRSLIVRERNKIKNQKVICEREVARSLLKLSRKRSLEKPTRSEDDFVAAETLLNLYCHCDNKCDEKREQHIKQDVFINETAVSFNEIPVVEPVRDFGTQMGEPLRDFGTQTLGKDELSRNLFLDNVMNEKKTYHYTGISKACLEMIFGEIEDKARRIHMWKGKKRTPKQSLHKKYWKQKSAFSKLSTMEQFVFTLVKLRRNTTLEMLCDIFGISTTVGSRIFTTWVLFLAKELDFLLCFASVKDLLQVPKPQSLKEIKNLRAIIDCTEFFIETPSKPSSQRSTYSHYKSHNTFKLLISISPVPHINFVSQLFTGSITDKEILSMSGFVDKLNVGDVVMADKGFNKGFNLLVKQGCHLVAPPVMSKNNISAEASTATRRVATSRVHIERAIKRLKAFGILKGVLSLTYKPYLSSIVKVCSALVNLQSSIISSDE